MTLNFLDQLPDGFLHICATELHNLIPEPSIISLEGRDTTPLFVSILLHGNETSGLKAVQSLLQKYQDKQHILPRSLILFVGNVEAAKDNVRHLAHQQDYNRIWNGGNSPDHVIADQVKQHLFKVNPFAVVDIHNNSGRNPHYSCINQLDKSSIYLASLFSHTIVYFTKPAEVLTMAFKDLCPSVTIECGLADDESGIACASQYLEDIMHLQSLDTHLLDPHDIHIFHTFARITIPSHFSIAIGKQETADLCFIEEIDSVNFAELAAGSLIGWRNHEHARLCVTDQHGVDIGDDVFTYDHGEIRSKCTLIPSMFTKNLAIIGQDCLGYVMERYPLPEL